MIKSFVILFSVFLGLECAIIPVSAMPRLAVIAETEDARPASDILTAQLSKSIDYTVLERDEIAKLFREQQLSMEGLTEQSDLSRLTGADGLILLRPMEKGNQKLLVARIVAVHPGVVLDTLSCPLPCADYDTWASLISTSVKQFLPKFEVLARDAIAVSILNIRAEYETETTKSLERNINKLLFTRLIQEPRVFVLERQSLDKLVREKSFSLKSEDKFWTASYILDGSFSEVNTNSIALNINLLAHDGTRITNIVNTGLASSAESIVDQTAVKILKALQITPSAVLWSPKDEAHRYYQESLWAYRWKLHSESISAIESSWALGNQTEEVAFHRLQCYLQSLASEKDTSFVVKRLLELYLDYRRMFPQKSLKEDVKKAHYYRDVINTASALFQKEEQNLAWGQLHHDVLMDIRSLILTVCREIDKQAEKEQMTSPIKDLIITQGYYWYDNPRGYIASLYRSLEGRNDSRGKLFVAIAHVRSQWLPEEFSWPDKILEAFNRYGPEFNPRLCHSSNSVNRLIGHYCALKWATTNQATITDSMDHLMDDLWESRNDVLNNNTTFYFDTFNLWAEKSMVLPADTKELYNERILKFHRKYLLYAINVRQIPRRWFRKIFENDLNMSLEEGLSFYNAHLTNPVSGLEYVRSAFDVVYVRRRVPIDIQHKTATHSFRVKMDNYILTKALEERLHEERQKKRILAPNPIPPAPPIAQVFKTSPYQSLVVTQYYSFSDGHDISLFGYWIADNIQDVTFANGKIWVALVSRLLMVDANTFTSTAVRSIARPDMQWVGSKLFLDAGAEITCLAPDGRLLQQLPKPNGDKDFRFHVFQDNLYFYKHGLIIRLDLKINNYQVIASTRRRPSQTLLDGTEFKVDRLFGSSDKLHALICHGPKGCGVYAFDPATKNWDLIENFIGGSHQGHTNFGWGDSHLIVKPCRGGTLFFDAPGGTGVELWSIGNRNKQLLFGLNHDEYKAKWTIPSKYDSDSKMAEYDGNNLYLLTPPKYDDYQVLLWFFEKDRESGVPIQLVFSTNNPAAEIIQSPTAGVIVERDHSRIPPNPLKVDYSANFILTGCPRGLIMAMKNAAGFWFLPMEDIRAYMTPKPALLQQQLNYNNSSLVPSDSVAHLNEQDWTSISDHSPVLGQSYVANLGGGVKLEMVRIPSGEFMMGSPSSEMERGENELQHKVVLTKGFWMGKYEVTQEQWQQVMRNNPSRFKGVDVPVNSVTWNDCQQFITKLNALISARNIYFALPTEAEWEYACRAGTTSRFYTGDSDSDLDRAGWYAGNSGGITHPRTGWYAGSSGGITHPVGRKQPNAWGLYDMHGNVREWCADWYAEYEPVAVRDPRGMNSGNERVLRSGDFTFSPKNCRSSTRFRAGPTNPGQQATGFGSGFGFRIVLHP
ncbi:MAG: SUMF1/EgtB/PvdO family nonheme iron enzyme [Kiritimatiellae bacterium]|nr:SUMF1/EgtB/PvdO family nonheme iron enzyme [Kiritimatiellia bacterium]